MKDLFPIPIRLTGLKDMAPGIDQDSSPIWFLEIRQFFCLSLSDRAFDWVKSKHMTNYGEYGGVSFSSL